jgi:antitoxin ParD1/3/4
MKSGRCQNASEVLPEGTRLIEQRERFEATKLKSLKEAAAQGWIAIAADDYADVAEDQLEDSINQLSEKATELAHGG